jgi:hypothetical protein
MAYTLSELNAQLAEVQASISKVLEAQSIGTTLGNSMARAQLSDLRAQRKELIAEIKEQKAADAAGDASGNAAGRTYAKNVRRF